MADTYYCEKCNRTMSADQFYGSNNLEKYPEGKLKQCKKDMTMHVDNFNPDTYLWILQECDVPYIPDEWNKLLESYARDKSKLTGMTILGRYLSKMKLKQYRDYRWKDTEFLQELANNKIEQTMKRQGYDAQQIAIAIDKASVAIPEGELVQPDYPETPDAPNPFAQDDYFAEQSGGADDFVDDLTEEDTTVITMDKHAYEQFHELLHLCNLLLCLHHHLCIPSLDIPFRREQNQFLPHSPDELRF